MRRLSTVDSSADDCSEPLYLWPENWRLWCLWRELETQWRYSPMGGPTGLDYAAVLAVIDRRFAHPRQRRVALYLVQAMEDAALAAWRERAPRDGSA